MKSGCHNVSVNLTSLCISIVFLFFSVGGGRGGGGNCFKCNESGHMARDCPNSESRGKTTMP